jgi:alkanesulfonate monooxygenase SsuD/methylene tetrahydromethanopterin reductase-like flavin-dependent oxidoreductase (luciferase family)
LGYVASTTQQAIDDFFPGYADTMTRTGRERGWPPVTRAQFDAQVGARGALLVGSPKEVAEKILRHSEALGGVSRFTFQMDVAAVSHIKLMEAITLLGKEVKPLVNAVA